MKIYLLLIVLMLMSGCLFEDNEYKNTTGELSGDIPYYTNIYATIIIETGINDTLINFNRIIYSLKDSIYTARYFITPTLKLFVNTKSELCVELNPFSQYGECYVTLENVSGIKHDYYKGVLWFNKDKDYTCILGYIVSNKDSLHIKAKIKVASE